MLHFTFEFALKQMNHPMRNVFLKIASVFVLPLFVGQANSGHSAQPHGQPPLTPERYLRDIVLCESPQLAHLFRLSDPNHSAYVNRPEF
jgi:hypothetical protein